MTAQERIDAAIEALPQATPGPWKAELCLGGSYVIDNTLPENGGKVRRIAEVYGHLSTPSDASLIAAAPDLVDEVIRLRKWQQEALPYLHKEIEQCKNVLGIGICECEECTVAKIRGKQLNRLIVEAQEDYVDGHKQC